MTLKEDIAIDLAENQFDTDEHADTIIYNGELIAGFLNYGEDPDEKAEGSRGIGFLSVQKADVPEPRYRDTVMLANAYGYATNILLDGAGEPILDGAGEPIKDMSFEWSVSEILKGDGDEWKLKLIKNQRSFMRL